MVECIQNYFMNQPASKVWLSSSCSRIKETPESDIDLLVAHATMQTQM